MEHKNVEYLFIFSTLNQITNYIAIKQLRPKNIYNITFDNGLHKRFKYGINPNKWEKNLENVLEKDIKKNIKPITIKECMYKDLKEFKKELSKSIEHINNNTPIYWHITGGQRVFAMPIYDIVKSRPNDILFYLEGNTETIISMGKNTNKFKSVMKYKLNDLDFETAFQLMGYDFKEKINSTLKLKEKGKVKEENINPVEKEFYDILYDWIVNNDKYKSLKVCEKEGTFRELLLLSNSTKNFSNKNVRQKFLKKLFNELKNKYPKFKNCSYHIECSNEMNNNFPAGYIFEKIVGYQIFEIIKDDPKILGMDLSLKVYRDDFSHCVDELDIALLTNTGRILNFECKSGSFASDNAKSHNFTTYALSGVFGAPIFMIPLLENENIGGKFLGALNAAKKANLNTICLDKIEGIKNLIG